MMAATVPERHAVYYPRIHFRNMEWLKGTLLAFGRVYRIVPTDHPLEDDPPELRGFSQRHLAMTQDKRKPLVFEIDPEWSAIEFAQERLYHELRLVDPAELTRRFGATATAAREAATGRYEIHRSKVHDGLFEQLLMPRGLAWPSPSRRQTGPWLRVHPDLGDAIMSVSTVASARETGSDVVTDAPTLHTAVAALDEGAILREFLRPGSHPDEEVPAERAGAQLAHVVMVTHFSTAALSFDDVAGLLQDGVSFRAFRNHMASVAQRIPPEIDQRTRERRLQELADEMVDEWNRLERSLPKRLLAGIGAGAAKGAEDVAKDAARTLATGGLAAGLAALSAKVAFVAAAPVAVPIALALVTTTLAWRRSRKDGPLAYLTHVKKAGGVQLAVPCSYRPEP